MSEIDVLIIGSGMGGATLAAALAPSGRRIVILERGHHLPDTPEARDPEAIFAKGYYRPEETWLTPGGERFNPGNYAYVGGNSKFYGAVLMRYRAEDFRPVSHMGGTTPGWPFQYEALEPYYQQAETMYQVRGDADHDPSEPPHSREYPFPPVAHEPEIADLRNRLRGVGLNPAPLPLGVDLDRWLQRGKTPWDAFPDTGHGKMDAESVGLTEALKHPNVTLLNGQAVVKIEALDGRATAVLTRSDRIEAKTIVVAAGAVHTAALLLRSANDNHPNGLANSSDQVGRNFMNHNASALLAISSRRNRAVYQKTLQINDWYLSGGPTGEPLGNVQLLGRVSAPILAAQTGLPKPLAKLIADRSIDFYVMSEDLPQADSRVTLLGDDIVLDWRRSNMEAHHALVAKLKQALRKAGFPNLLSKTFDRRTPSHQCGTERYGNNPSSR